MEIKDKPKKEAKELSGKINDLSEVGTFFEAPDIDISYYLSNDHIKKLEEKLGKKVVVLSIAFVVPETKSTLAIVIDPREEKKSLLIASEKKTAKTFYEALRAVKEEK